MTEEGKEQTTSFRRELLTKCQREFEKDKKDDEERERMQQAIDEAETVSVIFVLYMHTCIMPLLIRREEFISVPAFFSPPSA